MKPLEGTRILVWTPEPEEQAVEEVLLRLGGDVHRVESRDQFERALLLLSPDLIIARVTPAFRAPLEYLAGRRSMQGGPRLVVVVDPWHKRLYYEALQLGAFDGIGLPFDEKELARIAIQATADHCLLLSA
jgi:hypothetical protein